MATISISHHPTLDYLITRPGYSLVATQGAARFPTLYELEDGVPNREKVIFELEPDDRVFTFILDRNRKSDGQPSHEIQKLQPIKRFQEEPQVPERNTSANRKFYPGENFWVIVRPGGEGNYSALLCFGLCNCTSCQRSVDADPFKLESMKVDINSEIDTRFFSKIEVSFHPSCKLAYDAASPVATNLRNVLYYSNRWTPDIQELIKHLCTIPDPKPANIRATVKMQTTVLTVATLEANTKALQLMLKDDVFPDFTLLSSDGEEFKCHKIVLSVQSEELKEILRRKQTEGEESQNTFHLDEDGSTIEALLEWIYVKSESRISSSFQVASGLLRFGHLYHLPKLVKSAAAVLLKNLKRDTPQWNAPAALWNLYEFLQLVEKTDVVGRLKLEIVRSLAGTLGKTTLQNVRGNATEELKVFNGGEPVNQGAANDFVVVAVDLGLFDA